MVKVTPVLRSLVIEKHLYGTSLGQISKEIGISKTTSYNIVQDWNSRVSSLDLDDIRFFLSNMRKSGITIEQCVQGYRNVQILKQFDVDTDVDGDFENEELEEDVYENEEIKDDVLPEKHSLDTPYEKENTKDLKSPKSNSLFPSLQKEKDNSMVKKYQFSYFIENVYKNCKSHNIKPSLLVKWIEDLFNFYSLLYHQSTEDSSDENSKTDQRNTNVEEFQGSGLDEIYHSKIPFISKVSNFIKVKKNNVEYLENKKNLMSNDIDILEKQKMEKTSELNKVIEKENKVYSYFNWYSTLGKYLFKKYNILIDQEIVLFANALRDFKQYHFSATKILSEYRVIDSLRKEKKQIEDELHQRILTRDNILNEINSLEDQSNYYQRTIKVYQELHKEGMGLKELKKLNYLVMELHYENGLEVKDSIKKFLKDVEDQYDNKLGFEKKINELKEEMKKLEKQVPEYQSFLKLQGIVSPVLIHLANSGVTSEDIIDMNHLVLEFKNSDFLSDPIIKNEYNSNTNINTSKHSITKGRYWNVFVEKLKELKNINTEIKKQALNLDNLNSQISDLITNKKQIENVYANSVSNLNNVITKTIQFLDIARKINESTSKNILPVLILFPVFVDYDSPEDNDPSETQDSQ
jgi:hypothetical protein